MFADDAPISGPLALALVIVLVGPVFAGCLSGGDADIKQVGSSTVLPLAQAWAQEYDNASVSVSGGGSSHGREAVLTGNADIGDASSPITPGDYEEQGCEVDGQAFAEARQSQPPRQYPECNGVTPTEWTVAWDALTIVVHPDNDWVQGLNYTQLAAIFSSQNTAETWAEVPGLEDAPDEPIEIHAPDAASGTYEFFFEEVAGGTENSLLAVNSERYHGSSDDNTIVTKISQNKHAIGFFGLAYLLENEGNVQAVPIAEEGTDYVRPSFETATEYPITRPLFLYTDGVPGNDTKLHGYMEFIFSEEGQSIVPAEGYLAERNFEPETYQAQVDALAGEADA